MSNNINPIDWKNDSLYLLDQRKLPLVEEYVEVATLEDCHRAIKDMVTRGAPMIGFTAIYGLALWAFRNPDAKPSGVKDAGNYLCTSRPTAVNLQYEVERCIDLSKKYSSNLDFAKALVAFANDQIEQLYLDNKKMAKDAELFLDNTIGKKKYRLMTLCNTGTLACGPMGTALGVITHLAKEDKIEHVYASETRPYLQGARLTSYELKKESIQHEIVVEGSFSYLLSNKLVDAVFIGADRIVRNGDTANKVGSSTLSIVCKHYGVPFFVVAPTSSFDREMRSGREIEVELRPEDEILSCGGNRIAPLDVHAMNPSFDITTGDLITGIFCEKGTISPVSESAISSLLD